MRLCQNRRMRPIPLLLSVLCGLGACARVDLHGTPHATDRSLRIASYNTSLFSDEAGGVIRMLESDGAQARKIAAVLQRVRPDLVLLNEFDYDARHRAADLFQRR
jgi:hypothetical protein